MHYLDPYTLVIASTLVVILSYFFSGFSRRTNVPSVLLLIALGAGLKLLLDYYAIAAGDALFRILQFVGIVGLIMIVLEAALDLELTSDRKGLIVRSFLVALLSLAASSLGIAYLFHRFLIPDFLKALVYAIPLSIMSSAIIIPSVGGLVRSKKEFLVYESTISDILGILFFYIIIDNAGGGDPSRIAMEVLLNVVATVVLALAVSYGLVYLFQKLQSSVKLFFLISVLTLLYAVGKMLHLSALLIILVFGLVLNNHKVFFPGRLKRWVVQDVLKHVVKDFHMVTLETSFLVRTFFFVIFGMTLDLSSLLNMQVAWISLGVIGIIYGSRLIFLKASGLKHIFPELLVAPRGLITVLLFFGIPSTLADPNFSPGILLFTILATSLIMGAGLIARGTQGEWVESLDFGDWEELDREIAALQAKREKPS